MSALNTFAALTAALVAGVPCSSTMVSAGGAQYDVVEVPVLPGYPYPRTSGMNHHGHIVGGSWACPFILSCLGRAFMFDGTNVHDFTAQLLDDLPPNTIGITRGVDINDDGDVLFWLTIVDVGVFPYVYRPAENGTAPYFEIEGPPEAISATAWAINESGLVVGTYTVPDPPGVFTRAFTWTVDNGLIDVIQPPVGFVSSAGRGLNAAGDVVGGLTAGNGVDDRAFVWSQGAMTVLPPLPGHVRCYAVDINDAGFIVGISSDSSYNDSLVIWKDDRIVHSLTLEYSSIRMEVYDMSGAGEVVGNYWPLDEAFQPFAFRWTPSEGFQHLDALDLSIPNLNLWESTAVNETGQIVAWGEYPDLTLRGFLLTPAAIPGDLDGDGDVDPADLAILLGSWGPCPGECPPDLTGDGAVGPEDLAILLGNWGP